jgi:hypothetical protein
MALFILLFFALFPLINLVALAGVGTVICLLTHQEASRAAVQRTYDQAQLEVVRQAQALLNSGLAGFAKLRPYRGYQGSGADLYVEGTDYNTGITTVDGPNKAPAVVDLSTKVYEYRVQSTYDVRPFLDLSAVPGLSGIPGLGAPARITFTAHRAVEHPQGLDSARTPPALTGGASPVLLSQVTGLGTPGVLTDGDNSGWNHPGIYNKIKLMGQEIVQEEVLKVFAVNSSFTTSDITITPGDKLWIDYRADGLWSCFHGPHDADGEPGEVCPNGFLCAAMIGKLESNPSPFLLGKQQWNMNPPGTGKFTLMCNDYPPFWYDNTGAMLVRIIVAR